MPSRPLPVPQLPSFLPQSLRQTNPHRHHHRPQLQWPDQHFTTRHKSTNIKIEFDLDQVSIINHIKKILTFVSAAGGVATASSATSDDSTVIPDPSPETPLKTQNH